MTATIHSLLIENTCEFFPSGQNRRKSSL